MIFTFTMRWLSNGSWQRMCLRLARRRIIGSPLSFDGSAQISCQNFHAYRVVQQRESEDCGKIRRREKPVNMKCCQNLICFSCIMKSLNISKSRKVINCYKEILIAITFTEMCNVQTDCNVRSIDSLMSDFRNNRMFVWGWKHLTALT